MTLKILTTYFPIGLPGITRPAMLKKIGEESAEIVRMESLEMSLQLRQYVQSYSGIAHSRDDTDGCQKDTGHDDS
jgi:hypothetical protein